MKNHVNEGTDIQCCKCDGWIWEGDTYVYDYQWNYYHAQCYVDKLAELEHEYMAEYGGDNNEGMLGSISEEYNDITSNDIRKVLELDK